MKNDKCDEESNPNSVFSLLTQILKEVKDIKRDVAEIKSEQRCKPYRSNFIYKCNKSPIIISPSTSPPSTYMQSLNSSKVDFPTENNEKPKLNTSDANTLNDSFFKNSDISYTDNANRKDI
jgi:hypothetical protein